MWAILFDIIAWRRCAMPFYDPNTRTSKEVVPGLTIRPFWGENMLVSVVHLEPNTVLPTHSHPHEQISYMLEGELEFLLDEERRIMHPGDLVFIPGGIAHSATAGPQPVRLLDVFSPVREDLKV
jgi:quercetin dioxygenase-like cupin family protein